MKTTKSTEATTEETTEAMFDDNNEKSIDETKRAGKAEKTKKMT
jgi:hypothetical protein